MSSRMANTLRWFFHVARRSEVPALRMGNCRPQLRANAAQDDLQGQRLLLLFRSGNALPVLRNDARPAK